jgi:hypothetical protein
MTATSSRSGKVAIAFAKAVAKSHGVEVLGWNDDPGKEFVFLSGAGEKLQAYQEEMKSEGWYIWPPEPENEGFFLDIALYPPPAKSTDGKTPDVVVDDEDNSALPAGMDFHYAGLAAYPIRNIVVYSILPVTFLWVSRWTAHSWPVATKIVVSLIVIALTAICLLAFQFIAVDADRSNLTVRSGLRRRETHIAMSEIRKANVFRERDGTIHTTRYIGINLKSGKAFQISLPRQKQRELIALLRACIRA